MVKERPEDGVSPSVLIGGDGRSGTTVISLMLGAHPDLLILPELHFHRPEDLGAPVLEVIDLMRSDDWKVTTPGYQKHPEYRLPVQFVRRCLRAGIDLDTLQTSIEEELTDGEDTIASWEARLDLIRRCGSLTAGNAGKGYWGLKIMKLITEAESLVPRWPETVLAHVIRDGRDVAASQILDYDWGYQNIEEAIEGWTRTVGCHDQLTSLAPYLAIKYEEFVDEPRKALMPLLRSLDLDWSPEMDRFYEMDHALAGSWVHHPSREAAMRPVTRGRVGRYKRDLPTPWVRKFGQEASEQLREWGYDPMPRVDVAFNLGREGCAGGSGCRKRVEKAQENLGKRYLATQAPFENQVRAAWLNLDGVELGNLRKTIKKMSKGVRDINKAAKLGVTYKEFSRGLFLPDIVEINHSKEERAAGKMRSAYLKSVDEMGGYPDRYMEPESPECKRHYDCWWGAFIPSENYMQGDVETSEKLVAYINLRRYGDFALYNLILGHGDYMQYGVVLGLHLAVTDWICERNDERVEGLRTLVYAGYFQGREGLQQWKKKAGFAPGYLLCSDLAGAE